MNPSTDIVIGSVRAPGTAAARVALDPAAGRVARPSSAQAMVRTRDGREIPETFVKFESMVLQTFVKDLLPAQGEAVYGEGLAGEMWKSFMFQQLGETLARSGGIGIATGVLSDYYLAGEKRVPVTGVPAGPGKAEADTQDLMSKALVEEIQRSIARAVDEGPDATARSGEH